MKFLSPCLRLSPQCEALGLIVEALLCNRGHALCPKGTAFKVGVGSISTPGLLGGGVFPVTRAQEKAGAAGGKVRTPGQQVAGAQGAHLQSSAAVAPKLPRSYEGTL